MHEYSLVQSLVERVKAEATSRRAIAVHRVTVRIGELSGVDPELFQTAYDTFREGTLCSKAPLILERVAATWSCPRCGARVAGGGALRCLPCGVPARLDDGGDALMLNGIELEVD
ncbi:MAG: hydrogenase maturation nickel metallochaperone HypA [Anaeromyxobacteraceae bacterium]